MPNHLRSNKQQGPLRCYRGYFILNGKKKNSQQNVHENYTFHIGATFSKPYQLTKNESTRFRTSYIQFFCGVIEVFVFGNTGNAY